MRFQASFECCCGCPPGRSAASGGKPGTEPEPEGRAYEDGETGRYRRGDNLAGGTSGSDSVCGPAQGRSGSQGGTTGPAGRRRRWLGPGARRPGPRVAAAGAAAAPSGRGSSLLSIGPRFEPSPSPTHAGCPLTSLLAAWTRRFALRPTRPSSTHRCAALQENTQRRPAPAGPSYRADSPYIVCSSGVRVQAAHKSGAQQRRAAASSPTARAFARWPLIRVTARGEAGHGRAGQVSRPVTAGRKRMTGLSISRQVTAVHGTTRDVAASHDMTVQVTAGHGRSRYGLARHNRSRTYSRQCS
jgi:hypothetical protein